MTTKSRKGLVTLGLGAVLLAASTPGWATTDAEGKALFNLWSAAFGFDAHRIENIHVAGDLDYVFTTHKTADEHGIVDLLKVNAYLPNGQTGRVVLLLSPAEAEPPREDRFRDTVSKRKASILLRSPMLTPEAIGRIVDRAVAYHKEETDERLFVVEKVPRSAKALVTTTTARKKVTANAMDGIMARVIERGRKAAAKAKATWRRGR